MIEEHNALYEQGGEDPPLFTMAVNKFTDMSDEEFLRGYTGLRVPPEKTEQMKSFSFNNPKKRQLWRGTRKKWSVDDEVKPTDLKANNQTLAIETGPPVYKNWDEEGAVTAPLDQGGCGACWAFTTAAACESLAYISGYTKELEEFSVQQLLDCNTEDNYGCGGGWMYEGFQYVSDVGILKRSNYRDFERHQAKCQFSKDYLHSEAALTGIGFIEHDGRTNDQMRELIAKQPIGAGMVTTGMLNSYSTGILTEKFLHCSNENWEVNHGVLIVGYGQTEPEKPGNRVYSNVQCNHYWIIRNSWGSDWGEHGFMKLCADGVGSKETPLGTCLINKYSVWPTMNPQDRGF